MTALGLRWIPTVLVGLLVSTGTAFAQQGANDPVAGAEALFEEGVALGERGKWAEACKKFEGSQALDVAVGTLLRLGDCYERVGRRASAWARFREAQSLARAQGMADRERIATLRADALDPKLARLTIQVVAPTPQLKIDLNGANMPSASWGSALPVDAGNALVEASAPGYLTFRRQVTIPAGDGAQVTVLIPALALESQPQPAQEPVPETATLAPRAGQPREEPQRRPSRTSGDSGYGARALGVTFTVVGGIGLGAGGVLALLSARRNEDSLDECPNSARLCTPRGVQLREEATTLADTATISAAVGGGLVLTGVVVYFAGGSSSRSAERASVALTPNVSTSSLGLQARGRF